MHALVQWKAKLGNKNKPWRTWYVVFITAASARIIQGDSWLQFPYYISPHLPELATLRSELTGFEDEKKTFIYSVIGQVHYHRDFLLKEAQVFFELRSRN